jgi:DNA topoisomerase III
MIHAAWKMGKFWGNVKHFWGIFFIEIVFSMGMGENRVMASLNSPASGKALVVCEKPSVASDLLAAFGGGTRHDGYFEFSLGYITWCFGHLLELAPPEAYGEDFKRWEFGNLPIVPPSYGFKYGLATGYDGGKGAKKQLGIISKLLKDSGYLVNAADAGREGELIFWEAVKFAGWGKDKPAAVPGDLPCFRFWCSKMTHEGLQGAWNEMKPMRDYLPLARAAYCRSESDWLLGMNLTRGASLSFPRKWGPEKDDAVKVWSVGRVQTPVLALIVRRDLAIEGFSSKAFYEVRLDFRDSVDSSAESFGSVLQVPKGYDRFTAESGETKAAAFQRKEDAEAVLGELFSLRSTPWEVRDEVTSGVENPPGLFSLTDLQRWCNQAWGWTAQKTLEVAQAAYEEEKVLTYPRTTSAFLPEDSKGEMDRVHGVLAAWAAGQMPGFPTASLVSPVSSSRASFLFNDAKVSDHYAIVPTGTLPKDLESPVGKLWQAVVRRFLTAFADPARVRQVKRKVTFAQPEREATASGKVYESRGWMEADDALAARTGGTRKSSDKVLAACGPQAGLLSGEVHEGATTPPKPFDESSLLAIMENISSKLAMGESEDLEEGEVSLEELKEALSDLGLGTPATRAETIETLLKRGFIARVSKGPSPKVAPKGKAEKPAKGSAKYLCATPSGRFLISSLEKIKLAYLTEPLLTAKWEKRLGDMASGASKESREEFLDALLASIRESVGIFRTQAVPGQAQAETKVLDVVCPTTGKPVEDRGNYYSIAGKPNIRFWKKVAEKEIPLEEYLRLIETGQTSVMDGFKAGSGKLFSAKLIFDGDKFKFVFPERGAGESAKTVDGVTCPKSGEPVLEFDKFYRFPGHPQTAFWKTIAQRVMSAAEYAEMLSKGQTGLLDGFVSKKGSTFSAHVIMGPQGPSFKFADREGGGGGGTWSKDGGKGGAKGAAKPKAKKK